MLDYYEFLQISPNADFDTIHRVYRFLAARYHPDNPNTGDAERFRLLHTAYEMLSDKDRRAEYDAARKSLAPEPFSSTVDFMDSLEGELNRRLAVLAVLYQRRRANADFPQVTLAEIEERMGFPRDYLDFTLWYLLRKGYVGKTDGGRYDLTADGVDFVEARRSRLPNLHKMLASGHEPTAEDIEQANKAAAAARSASDREKLKSRSKERRVRPERRVGAPDLRVIKTERRRGPKDRRRVPAAAD